MKDLLLTPLTRDRIPDAVELDKLALGGMWTADGYQREVDSPNAILLTLQQQPPQPAATAPLLALGCLWMILEEGHITLLAVRPEVRGQGLGQALLVELMAAAWQHNLEWVALEVRNSNQTALSLYKKFNFCAIGHRKRYYQNPEEDALILWNSSIKQPEFAETLKSWRRLVGDRLYQSNWQLCRDASPETYPSV